jgi:hypothetical protein
MELVHNTRAFGIPNKFTKQGREEGVNKGQGGKERREGASQARRKEEGRREGGRSL